MNSTELREDMITRIVAAYAGRPDVGASDIVDLLNRLRHEMQDYPVPTAGEVKRTVQRVEPAVPIDQAITRDKVYCLCCGKGFKMLKRHLGAEHGLSEAEYRAMFDLSPEVALVAPSYSTKKANFAKASGFGKYARPTTQKRAGMLKQD